MDIDREQINLLRARRSERWEALSLWPTRDNLNYLGRFFKRQKKLFLAAIVFLFTQGLFEVILVIISHRYLKNSEIFSSLNYQRLSLILLVLSIIYLAVYFLAIKSERTLIIRLINDLRLKWFKLALQRPSNESDLEYKGLILAKISYHLPLLSTGLTNSLIGVARYLLLVIILFFLCFIFGFNFFWLLLGVVIISLLIILAAFFVSKNYVSRETTFYSKIIRLVDFSLSDWSFTKLFKRERAILRDFNYLVDLDSYFRVRRELYLRFGGGIIFVVLIFSSLFLDVFGESVSTFLNSSAAVTKFSLAVVLIYFSRLLYESLRIGLYSVPFLLGLSLSVPTSNPKKIGLALAPNFSEVIFKSHKVKFFKQGGYHKNLEFKFKAGGRYLITGPRRIGKTLLAKLLTGASHYGNRAWLIKAKGQRYFYHDFFEKYRSFYYLDPKFTSQRTLLEVALGQEKQDLRSEDIERITERVKAHAELRDIFFEKEDWRLKANKFLTNPKNTLLLQVLYCLEKKPYLIALDNLWLDSEDSDIIALLKLLDRELPQSILVFFATEKVDLGVNYNYYEL